MKPALVNAVTSALASIGATSPGIHTAARADALYEAFALSCVLRALRSLGATFQARDGRDRPTTVVQLRTKPGFIHSQSFSFIHVRMLAGREYELHTDVRVLGKSQVLHELDVALIERSEAVRCRQHNVLPRGAKARLLVECKFYGRRLPLHLGREYVGLSSEFSLRAKTIVSNVGSSSVHTLVASHRGTENFDVSPLAPVTTDRFVQWLANELKHVLP